MKTKYDLIGKGYNQTRKPDPYLASRMMALLAPKQEGIYLDIGCGTGNYTCVFQKQGFNFIGVDPSATMLEKAKANQPKIQWIQAQAESIPLPDQYFHGILGSLTIHHWQDLTKAMKELRRVCKAQSKFVLFTSTPSQMEGYWLNHYFPNMMKDSMLQMPSFEVISQAMENGGWQIEALETYDIQPDLADHFLYVGKEQPELYLNPAIRSGISSFSSLANQKEVEKGLRELEEDIKSKKVSKIIERFKHNKGDYLFIIAH
ncbi:MAG: class I SAM-dependent methyltransferase [Bacteroidota bacterium]